MAARQLATAKHLAQFVIAGLVPAIHASDRLLASLERLGAAAEWALGTSPRATTGMVGYAGAITANDLSISCGLAPGDSGVRGSVARSPDMYAGQEIGRASCRERVCQYV